MPIAPPIVLNTLCLYDILCAYNIVRHTLPRIHAPNERNIVFYIIYMCFFFLPAFVIAIISVGVRFNSATVVPHRPKVKNKYGQFISYIRFLNT